MSRVRAWLAVAAVLLLGAGIALGTLIGQHLAPPRAEASWLGVAPTEGTEYWRDWIVASDGFWADLGLDASVRSTLQERVERAREEDSRLRERLAEVAASVRSESLAELAPSARQRAEAILSMYESDRHAAETVRELSRMRTDLALRPEQEPTVYRILFDAARQRHEAWTTFQASAGAPSSPGGRPPKPDRDAMRAMRERMEAIYSRREERMRTVLDEAQNERYEEIIERRRRWHRGPGDRSKTEHRGDEKKRDDRDDAPPKAGAREESAPAAGDAETRGPESPSCTPDEGTAERPEVAPRERPRRGSTPIRRSTKRQFVVS